LDVKAVLGAESEILDVLERLYGSAASTFGRIIEGIDEGNIENLEEIEDIEQLKDLASRYGTLSPDEVTQVLARVTGKKVEYGAAVRAAQEVYSRTPSEKRQLVSV
jgi:hypothetical protein